MTRAFVLAACAGILCVMASCAPKGGNLGRRVSSPVDNNPVGSPVALPAR